jgi:hypothetical protein
MSSKPKPALFGTTVEAAILAALAALLIWKAILPAWRVLNTDFPNYYLVARLLREGYSLDRVYDWVWLQRVKDHWGLDQTLVGFAGLTPFSALPIVPLTIFSALTAKRIWIVVNLLFLAWSAELLHRSTSLGRRRVWILCLLAFAPLRTQFLYGQMHLLVLLLIVMAYWFERRRRQVACGVCLALAAALKIYPIAFGLYFLWKRQWRSLLAMIGATACIIVITCMWIGSDVVRIYATQMLPRSLQGEMLDPYNWHAGSAAALLHRLLLFEPSLNPAPLLNSPSIYAVIYPLWQLAVLVPLFALIDPGHNGDRPRRNMSVEWASLLLALLLLSPVPSSYHFVVMIFAIVLLINMLQQRSEYALILATLSLYVLLSVAEFWTIPSHPSAIFITLIGFARLWLVGVLYAISLLCLLRLRTQTSAQSRNRYALLATASAFVAVIGIAGYKHHFAFRQEQMSQRVVPSLTSYLATGPQPLREGFDVVSMTPVGYRVINQDAAEVLSNRFDRTADQLSFDVATDGSALFIEMADTESSRIIRLSDGSVIAEDAESPRISPDGRTLAFIREYKGRGALYVADSESVGKQAPLRLTTDDYDVRSIAWKSEGYLLFAGKHHGSFGLFKSLRQESTPALLSSMEIGSFSISPDGSRLAISQLVHSRWQLAILNLSSNELVRLTFSDCNAYTPAWMDASTILYATDCGRGVGLTALATAHTSMHH